MTFVYIKEFSYETDAFVLNVLKYQKYKFHSIYKIKNL